jgi:DNA polymerase-3 subunit delta'
MADWPVIGHEWAVDLLARAVSSGRPSHAYLLSGPAQSGKVTLARAFAQALLCEVPGAQPCGQCRACQRIALGRYPDVQTISAERNTIQIEQVRSLQRDAALSPLEAPYRVFILREIERATPAAANALLKTLEEPPGHVILVLSCVRRDLVLPTIVSRCQLLGLRPLPIPQVEAALTAHWQVPADRARLLARLSAGRLGWAVRVHKDPDLRRLDDLVTLTGQQAIGRLAYSEALGRQPESIEQTLGLWATWWRDLLLVQRGLPEAVINLDRREQIEAQALRFLPAQIDRALADVIHTLQRIRANVNARLALDVLALRLPVPVH